MKLSRVKMLALAALFLSPAIAWAAPGDGLLGTDHDFASGLGAQTAGVPVGLCTFCHTPHKAMSTLLLWNHTLSSATFNWDVPTTTAGTNFPTILGPSYKGATAKCLSCHDGSVAIGDIAWFKETNYPGGTGLSTFKMSSEPSHQVGGGGAMAGNHPVAMPYPYNNAANTYNASTTGPAATLGEWQADPTLLASSKIRLFNDNGSGAISAGVVAGKTGIECSTCHDPHNKAAVDEMFLRGMITGSTQGDGYLCLQCHKK
ncbi:MAG: hypothetical protein GZ089_00485 [Aromatoleum sp.]|nr:hypothetical protein [Aromatoleum sp.]